MPGASMPAAAPRSSLMPATASISSAATPPGLSSRKSSPSTLTMVDSSPTGVAPPSTTSLIFAPRSAATASAVVALILPEELALGAASGRPSLAISSPPKPLGMRSAIVSSPAVTSGWMPLPDRCGSTSVSGPGQNASANLFDSGSKTAMRSAMAMIGDMGDQRIEARSALGFEDARDADAVGGIAGQPVDGLGRDGDDIAAFKQRQRPLHRLADGKYLSQSRHLCRCRAA